MQTRRKRAPLPAHFIAFEGILKRTSPEAIERAVTRMRDKIPNEFQRCALPLPALRFVKLRKEDLRHAGVPTGVASRFADAEARYRLQLARVAGDASAFEWAVTLVELLPNGELAIIVDIPGGKDSRVELKWSFPNVETAIIGNRVADGEVVRSPSEI